MKLLKISMLRRLREKIPSKTSKGTRIIVIIIERREAKGKKVILVVKLLGHQMLSNDKYDK